MGIDFEVNRPIYVQVQEDLILQIISGSLQPGDRLPSIRDLAFSYRVNPNTVQRALMELDRLGLTQAERTSGRYVRAPEEEIQKQKEKYILAVLAKCEEKLNRIGITVEEACSWVRQSGKRKEKKK